MSSNIDRFDFEQQLMECWRITDDINIIYEYVCNTPTREVDQDKIANILLGIKQLYELKFNSMFDNFEELVRQRQL